MMKGQEGQGGAVATCWHRKIVHGSDYDWIFRGIVDLWICRFVSFVSCHHTWIDVSRRKLWFQRSVGLSLHLTINVGRRNEVTS